MSSHNVLLEWKGTEEDYLRSHKVFLKKSGQVSKIVGSLRSHVPSMLENISCKRNAQDKINILSIGSGHGVMDLEILKIVNDYIQRESPNDPTMMFNRAIEPNESSLSFYKNAVDNLPQELSNAQIVFDIDRPKTIEEYMVDASVKQRHFDIVHFIHSLYHIDVEIALKHCYEKELGKKGIIIVVLARNGDTLEIVKERVYGISPLSNEISKIAGRNGWNHKVYTQEYSTDVTEVFDEHSLEGNLLLDFFAHVKNFRFENKPETVNIVLELIKDNSIVIDGKRWSKNVEDTHFIIKY